jgi:transposase
MAIEMKVVGLDVAKNVFQVHGVDRRGETILRKRLRRPQVTEFFRHRTPCLIGIEATQGAHYWARVLRALGHEVRLLAPQFVKPYLKSQKNDANDAEAICEAVSRPNMRFVPSKSIEQQDLQALHRIRSRMIGSRTQLGNQIRGLLAEYGIVLPLHLSQVRAALPRLIEDDNPLLSGFGRQLLAALYEELCALEQRIEKIEEQVQQIHRSNPLCQKIAAVEGVGPVTATAVVAAIADGRTFHSGRQFAAWIGLVPRQHSSGDKQRHFGITKRGDPYLRMLLVHGARSVVYRAPNKNDSRSQWIAEKQRKLGTAKTCVAVANKNARVIWALLVRDEPYRRAA